MANKWGIARNRIETFKRELEERRRRFEEHRELARKQDTVRETLEREIRRTTQKHRVLAQRTAEARSFLCREAAGLYSLRIKKRRSGRVEYLIGGVPIPHLLQDLNGEQNCTHPMDDKSADDYQLME